MIQAEKTVSYKKSVSGSIFLEKMSQVIYAKVDIHDRGELYENRKCHK